MYEAIILFMLFALNVFASLFNTCLCIYFTYCDARQRLSLLCKTAFMFGAFVIVCDILFCTYIILLK